MAGGVWREVADFAAADGVGMQPKSTSICDSHCRQSSWSYYVKIHELSLDPLSMKEKSTEPRRSRESKREFNPDVFPKFTVGASLIPFTDILSKYA